MPFTPFHFGPAVAVHAIAPRQISFLSFCAANVLIDVEPLYYMVTDQYPLHRFFHTYVGACVALVMTIAIFAGARRLASVMPLPNLFGWKRLTMRPIALGAALGSFSHILLDSVMHGDVHPLWPVSNVNSLHGVISLRALHGSCIAAGFLGLIVVGVRRVLGKGEGEGGTRGPE